MNKLSDEEYQQIADDAEKIMEFLIQTGWLPKRGIDALCLTLAYSISGGAKEEHVEDVLAALFSNMRKQIRTIQKHIKSNEYIDILNQPHRTQNDT